MPSRKLARESAKNSWTGIRLSFHNRCSGLIRQETVDSSQCKNYTETEKPSENRLAKANYFYPKTNTNLFLCKETEEVKIRRGEREYVEATNGRIFSKNKRERIAEKQTESVFHLPSG